MTPNAGTRYYQSIKNILILLLFSTLIQGCKDDSNTDSEPVSRTVIVYLGVDNNFAGEEKDRIADLLSTWRDYSGRLVVYTDNGKKSLLQEIVCDGNTATSQPLKQYTNHNSADPAVLRQVLTDAVNACPAESYGLVVLSHASGWLPANTLVAPRSIITDKNSEMDLHEFAAALPVNFDFVIFDACFMGSVEVAYELKDKVNYVVASAAEVLVPGFMYSTMMQHLMKKEPDLVAVATEFWDYYNRKTGLSRSATVSVIATAKMEPLADLSAELLRGVDGEKRVNLSSVQTFGYGRHLLYFDFGDYIKNLYPERAEEFNRTLKQCLLYTNATPGYYSAAAGYNAIKAYSGLTVYVPQANYPYINSRYQMLKWSERIASVR